MASCQKFFLIHRIRNPKLWQETMSLTMQMKDLNSSFLNYCSESEIRFDPLVRPFIGICRSAPAPNVFYRTILSGSKFNLTQVFR